MSRRFSPTQFPSLVKKKPEAEKDGNALWRTAQWFPKMDPDLLERLKAYHGELMKFNLKLNLVSRVTERESDELHFADSVLACQILLEKKLGNRVFDIGSGNGLPGMVLAMMDPKCEVILVESDSRKCEFLKHVTHALTLKNVGIMNVRFESLRDVGITVGISRGFASISKTILACNRIFPKGGRFFHLKGNNWSSEIADLPSQLISLWTPELLGEYTLPASQARRAIVCTHKIQD